MLDGEVEAEANRSGWSVKRGGCGWRKPMKGELGGAGPFRGVVAEAEGDVVVRLEGRPWWEAERAKKQEREESRANFERGRR